MSELCKCCGHEYRDARSLTQGMCSRNPNGRYHEAYEGRVGGDYTCKYCGRAYRDVRSMVQGFCSRNPERNGRHSPAR